MRKFVKFAAACAAAVVSPAAFGSTYYIATDGDDGAAGTLEAPLKSLSVALEKAQDGDVIHIGPGDHIGMAMTSANCLGVISRAVTVEGEGESVTILHGLTSGSGARQQGITVDNAGATVRNLALTDLFSSWTDDDSSYTTKGAALMVNAGTASVCRVFNNRTGGNNGRIPPVRVSGTGVLVDSIITNNVQGSWGKGAGGLYQAGGEVRRCLIAFNKGPEKNSPNGVWVAGGTFADNVVYKNTRQNSGPYGLQASGGTVERCVIAANEGTTAGLGVTGAATVRNCLVYGNSSSANGTDTAGGLLVNNASAVVSHLTVVGNTGKGGTDGVRVKAGAVAASVFWANGLVDFTTTGGTVGFCCYPGATGTNIDGDPQFSPATFAYHPSVADYDAFKVGRFSLCRDGATTGANLAADDLVGNLRPAYGEAGTDYPDVGCYELQPAGADEYYLGMRSDKLVLPSEDSVTFMAFSEGQGKTAAEYVWAVTTNGVTTSVTTTEPSFTIGQAPGGSCSVTLTAYDANGVEIGRATTVVTVKPRTVYLSTAGSATYPYATPETATASLYEALATVWTETDRPGRIIVAPGTYPELKTLGSVTAPIEIIGPDDPETAVLRFKSSDFSVGFVLGHPQAKLSGVTIKGTTYCDVDSNYVLGGALRIEDGVVSNCVITGFNTASGSRGTSTLAVRGGLVTHTAVTNNPNSSAFARGVLGVYMDGGTLEHSIISDNPFYGDRAEAGALWQKGGTVRDCRIERNTVANQCVDVVAGARISGGTFERCVVGYNKETKGGAITVTAGVKVDGSATVRNVLIVGNETVATAANSVGGLAVTASGADVCHVTVLNNLTSATIGGLRLTAGTVRGAIVSGNRNSTEVSQSGGTLAYSCFPTAAEGTDGNIAASPNFEDALGHISRSSPCRDAARYGVTLAEDDLEGNPRVSYGESDKDYPDMGCYELQASSELVASIGVSTDDTFVGDTVTLTVSLEGPDTEVVASVWTVAAGGVTNVYERTGATLVLADVPAGSYSVSATARNASQKEATAPMTDCFKAHPRVCHVALGGSDTWPYDTSAKAASNLCDALDAVYCSEASRGEVLVHPGVYVNPKTEQQGEYACAAMLNKNVAVRGLGETPAETRIDLTIASLVSAVRLYHEKALLENLTLTVCGWGKELINIETSAMGLALHVELGTVSNCVVTGCKTSGSSCANPPFTMAGGLAHGVLVKDNVYDSGYARAAYGACLRGGTFENGEISGNGGMSDHAPVSGLYMTGGRLQNTVVSNNYYRGGVKGTVYDNKCGGINATGGTLLNVLVARNSATTGLANWTGGLRMSGSAKAINVTVVDNVSDGNVGEQLTYAGGTLANAIVEGKASGTPSGTNLLTMEPVAFLRRARGDYRLSSAATSCIDTGDDSQWADLAAAVDLSGGPRLFRKHVDLGCYEYSAPGFIMIVK